MLGRSSAGEDEVLGTILTKRDDEFKATVTRLIAAAAAKSL